MEHDPLIGTQVGAYHIQSRLGEGGMARVYKAYHERLRRDVAIKVILAQIADSAGFQARFEREAQLIASLEHPNIVAVYDFGEMGELTYLVMQYVGGGTLRDQMRTGRPIESGRAVRYAVQMARALHHAHQRGIVHRDVKPQNMLVSATDAGQLLLSDFGIAKLYEGRDDATYSQFQTRSMSGDPALTSVDQIVGTAEYMAPEQVNGQSVDARTDVYALGVVLYQMLTGQAPFRSTTLQGLLFQQVYAQPQPVREINPAIPEPLAQITARAMAKAPEGRFQSAEQMAQALENVNSFATNPQPFSAPLPDDVATYGRYATDPPTIQSQQRSFMQGTGQAAPSFYGQQAAAAQAMASNYGITPAHGLPGPNTNATGLRAGAMTGMVGAQTGEVQPAGQKRKFPLSYILIALVVIGGLGLGLYHFLPAGSGAPNLSQTFSEQFKDNHYNWTVGSLDNGNFTAAITNGQYTMTVGNQNNTYFPHPEAASVGALPSTFTLTTSIMQTAGNNNFYGLAFHFKEDGAKVSCYALVISGAGAYQILKYDPSGATAYQQLWSAQLSGLSGLNHTHTLQVKGQGSVYTFAVDGKTLNTGNGTSLSDSSFSGGTPALLVTGPNGTFVDMGMQLMVN